MESVKRLTRFLKPYWRWMVLAPLLMTLEVAMDLLQPKLIERIVDVGIANLDLSVVLGAGALMIGLALIGAVGGGRQRHLRREGLAGLRRRSARGALPQGAVALVRQLG